jgi:hypothetical protein
MHVLRWKVDERGIWKVFDGCGHQRSLGMAEVERQRELYGMRRYIDVCNRTDLPEDRQ